MCILLSPLHNYFLKTIELNLVDLLVTSFFIEHCEIVYCYLININTKKSRKFITVKSFYFVGYLITWNSWARRSTNLSTLNIKSPRLDFRIYL